jgi:hypothetical protein
MYIDWDLSKAPPRIDLDAGFDCQLGERKASFRVRVSVGPGVRSLLSRLLAAAIAGGAAGASISHLH